MTRSCCYTATLYIAVRGWCTWKASHRLCQSVLESSLKCIWIFLLHTLPMGAASRYTSFSYGDTPRVLATTCASTYSVNTLATSWTAARWMVAVAHSATAPQTWRLSPIAAASLRTWLPGTQMPRRLSLL